jgi:hypothetical protein
VVAEVNLVQPSPDINCHHVHYVQSPSATSQCVDMSAVCMPGAAYYPQPLYVFAHVPPAGPIIYPGPGMTSASMIASPVLTTAGYMTSLPAHILPQQVMLPTSLLPPPTHAVLSSMIDQPPPCSIVVPGALLPAPASNVIPPGGYVPQGHMTTSNSKPVGVVEGLSVAGFVEQTTFSAIHGVPEPAGMTQVNVDGKVQCSFQLPVTNVIADSTHVCEQPAVNHFMTEDDGRTVPDNTDSSTFESVVMKCSMVTESDVGQQSKSSRRSDTLESYPVESREPVEAVDENAVMQYAESVSAKEQCSANIAASTSDRLSVSSTACQVSSQLVDVIAAEDEMKTDLSEDSASGLLNIKETSQWPAIGQASPVAAISSPAVPKPKMQSWASLLKDTATATNAIIINSSDQQTLANYKLAETKLVQAKDAPSAEKVLAINMSCNETEKRKIAGMYNYTHLSLTPYCASVCVTFCNFILMAIRYGYKAMIVFCIELHWGKWFCMKYPVHRILSKVFHWGTWLRLQNW